MRGTVRTLTLLALAIVTFACRASGPVALRPAPELVGVEYLSSLPGVEDLGGFVLDQPGGIEWGVHRVTRGSDTLLLLERLLRRVEGKPYWQVRAAVYAPQPPPGYALWLFTCSTTDQWDSSIVAVVRQENKPILDDVMWAWRIDTAGEQFVSIPTDGIRCEVEGFGE